MHTWDIILLLPAWRLAVRAKFLRLNRCLKIIQGFIDNFSRFKEEFGVFGETLQHLKQTYDQIVETRYNKMSVQIRKIEKLEGFGEIKAPQDESK